MHWLSWWLKYACQDRRRGFDPWAGKISWRRKWQPPPVFLPGKSHGQRSLVGYSPWGHKESDTTVKKQVKAVPLLALKLSFLNSRSILE